MKFSTVVCLDDLLRETFWPAKEFVYDLVRLPIHLACGIDIAKSPRNDQRHNLLPGFDARRFVALASDGNVSPDWSQHYFGIASRATEYLLAHLPAGALVLSYEMPPWLRSTVDAAGLAWLDLRVAPLRFGSDLCMALATNRADLYTSIHAHALNADEVLAEAALLTAKLRYRLRYRSDCFDLEGCSVYIGQTGDDASLLVGPGRYMRAADAAPALQAFVGSDRLVYKPHPYAGPFAEQERHALAQILGYLPQCCEADTYDLLAGDARVRLIGISSGVLQEAAWFAQEARTLKPALCEPGFDARHDAARHLLVASHRFLSEPLWADVLGAVPRANPLRLPPQANRLRELHNTWWSYSTTTIRDSIFYKELFEIQAGADRAALATCRDALGQAHADIAALRRDMTELRRALATQMA
jgi:hypothetical protein